ncbi:MAG: quinol:electron acceptor oxidoreductase subunit ActD [bacterium]
MSDKILYAYSALFKKPDDIIKAAEKTADAGFTVFDVNTPYPLHGMNKAMKLKPSKLGYFALAFGLSGVAVALATISWMMVMDYPLVIGGKPFFSFPAFVPVMFEVTVLFASVFTVLAMLFIFFKFPNISHPLHDTGYMKKVSSDHFGIVIQAKDPKFNEEEVLNLFKTLDAVEVAPIYFDSEEISHKPKIFESKFIGFLVVTFILVSGATYFTLNKLLFMEPFNWMMEQDKTIPQEKSNFFADEFGMRKPVEGTIARGFLPYAYANQPDLAGELLLNPLLPTNENLEMGKTKYNIYCSPCHGNFGEGDSRLRGQFPNPPSLHSEKVTNWTDGRIYHVITEGQNVMPSYSSQLNQNERWATILYIRVLQRALNAKESDLQ